MLKAQLLRKNCRVYCSVIGLLVINQTERGHRDLLSITVYLTGKSLVQVQELSLLFYHTSLTNGGCSGVAVGWYGVAAAAGTEHECMRL